MRTIYRLLRMSASQHDSYHFSQHFSYEGDNFVLDSQVVRAAFKSYNSLTADPDQPLGLHATYLRLLNSDRASRPAISSATWQDHEAIISLLEYRAALAVQSAAKDLDHSDPGINQRLSKAITEAFIATQVADMISNLDQLPPNAASALRDLYLLVRFRVGSSVPGSSPNTNYFQYLLTSAEAALVDLFAFGLLCRSSGSNDTEVDPTRDLRAAINAVCLRLLPNAVGLTDAFSFPDWALDR